MKRELLRKIWEAQGRACYICDKAMTFPAKLTEAGAARHHATQDHVWPRALNGPSGPINILLAHRSCNEKKGARAPTERELMRFETTFAALDPLTLSQIAASAMSELAAARRKAAAAMDEERIALRHMNVLLRFVPTQSAANILAGLE